MKIIGKAIITIGDEKGDEFLIHRVVWNSYPRDYLGTINP